MLPHAKGLRNVDVDSLALWLRSVSLLSKAVVFPGYFEQGAIDRYGAVGVFGAGRLPKLWRT
jgi:hypothetical protein